MVFLNITADENIVGVGIDVEENQRIQRLIDRWQQHFLEKVFTAYEIKTCLPRKDNGAAFTARFAAKEALLKALGTGLRQGLSWKDMEIRNDELGKPYFCFYGNLKDLSKDYKILLSLSHTRTISAAIVVIQKHS